MAFVPWLALASATFATAIQMPSPLGAIDVSEGDRWPSWPFGFPNPFAPFVNKSHNATRVQKLENDDDMLYYATVWVGGQRMKAIVDTGSFQLLVFGKNCSDCGQTLYDHGKSKVSNVTNIETSHTFGSGTAYSVLVYDKFTLAGLEVSTQQFWEVVGADMYLADDGAFQAIFGVGPPSSAVKYAEQARDEVHKQMDEYKKSGQIVTPETREVVKHYDDMVGVEKRSVSVLQNLALESMSVCLGYRSGSAGHVYWNDHAARDEPEKFISVDVVGDLYWSAELADVRVESESPPDQTLTQQTGRQIPNVDLGCKVATCNAILDTGTALLGAPSLVVDAIWEVAEKWAKSGGTCDDLSELPELRFRIGGHEMKLPPESYMGLTSGSLSSEMQMYMPRLHEKTQRLRRKLAKSLKATPTLHKDDGDDDDLTGDYSDGSSLDPLCAPLMMHMEAVSQFGQLWILGVPFFRKYYTSFQLKQNAMGGPEPATMSFSVADGKCQPGQAPGGQGQVQQQLDKQDGEMEQHKQLEPRPATMQINAKKLRVPTMLSRTSLRGTTRRHHAGLEKGERRSRRKIETTDQLSATPFYRI